ncbi:MAG TPA: aspartate-semialdehyde dehydrogenase [Nitrospiria bacterium]
MLRKKDGYIVAIVGATGAVGREMLAILEDRKFPVKECRLLASERTAGETLSFCGQSYTVQRTEAASFNGVEIALFTAGEDASREFAPIAVRSGAIVIDNSAEWRMNAGVPLVVPEVNMHAAFAHKGIIANPNCSTIQMVVALKPLHDAARIKRIVVSSYQSVSGTGREGMEELTDQVRALMAFQEVKSAVYPHQIAFNLLPQIGSFNEQGHSSEEMKLINETLKIMEDPRIGISATSVRVPVFLAHSESVNIETERKLSANEARAVLSMAPGVLVFDDPQRKIYPMPIDAAGKDEVYVGRIREDPSVPAGLNLWIVADNLRKGAALNAIQIAEKLVEAAS